MSILQQYKEQIKEICMQHEVETLYAFGSVDTDHFNQESDIDLLVKFKPFDLARYFDNYMDLKSKLEELLQRNVDLLEEQTLRNPVLIRSIERSKKLIYG